MPASTDSELGPALIQFSWLTKESSEYTKTRKKTILEACTPVATVLDDKLYKLQGYSAGESVILWSQPATIDGTKATEARISSVPGNTFIDFVKSSSSTQDTNDSPSSYPTTHQWQKSLNSSGWRPRPDSTLMTMEPSRKIFSFEFHGNDVCAVAGRTILFRDIDHWLSIPEVEPLGVIEGVAIPLNDDPTRLTSSNDLSISNNANATNRIDCTFSGDDDRLDPFKDIKWNVFSSKAEGENRQLKSILKPPRPETAFSPVAIIMDSNAAMAPPYPPHLSTSQKTVKFVTRTKHEEQVLFDLPIRYDVAAKALNTASVIPGSGPTVIDMDSYKVKGPTDDPLPDEGGYRSIDSRGSAYSRKFKRLHRREARNTQRQMMRIMSDWMFSSGLKSDGPGREIPQVYPSIYRIHSLLAPGWRELSVEGNDFEFSKLFKGSNFYLAQTKRGSIYSWGANQNGTLGLNACVEETPGPLCVFGVPSEQPNGVTLTNDMVVLQVACGSRHSLVMTAKGGENELWGWGCNRHGRLGTAVSVENVIAPTRLMLFVAVEQEVGTPSQLRNPDDHHPLPTLRGAPPSSTSPTRPPTSQSGARSRLRRRRGLKGCLGVCLEEDTIQTIIHELDASRGISGYPDVLTLSERMRALNTNDVRQIYCQDTFSFYLLQDGSLLIGGIIIESDLELGSFPLRQVKCGNLKFRRLLRTTGVKNWIGAISSNGRVVVLKIPYSIPEGDVVSPDTWLMNKSFLTSSVTNMSLINTLGWEDLPTGASGSQKKNVPYDKIPFNSSHLVILS